MVIYLLDTAVCLFTNKPLITSAQEAMFSVELVIFFCLSLRQQDYLQSGERICMNHLATRCDSGQGTIYYILGIIRITIRHHKCLYIVQIIRNKLWICLCLCLWHQIFSSDLCLGSRNNSLHFGMIRITVRIRIQYTITLQWMILQR